MIYNTIIGWFVNESDDLPTRFCNRYDFLKTNQYHHHFNDKIDIWSYEGKWDERLVIKRQDNNLTLLLLCKKKSKNTYYKTKIKEFIMSFRNHTCALGEKWNELLSRIQANFIFYVYIFSYFYVFIFFFFFTFFFHFYSFFWGRGVVGW